MIDLLSDIRQLLLELNADILSPHPAAFVQFPCILLSESSNEVHAQSDGAPHLHEVEYTLEIYSPSLAQTHTLAAGADEKLSSLGFRRVYCCDLFDDDARAHRRVMRYRALCDNHGVLTQ